MDASRRAGRVFVSGGSFAARTPAPPRYSAPAFSRRPTQSARPQRLRRTRPTTVAGRRPGTVYRMWPRKSALEQRVDAIMERVSQAGDDHVRLVAVLEEYLRLAHAEGDGEEGFFFDVGAWSESLADSYLALGRVDDAVRVVAEATRGGHCEGAEMLCEFGEKLMRSGHEPQAKDLWSQALAGFPDDVWIYVQAGIEYGDLGDHVTALGWLTPGAELALGTGDPESALEQLVPLRAASLAATGHRPDDLQARARRALAGATGDAP
jgi:tetratricopeptide (TPR) repeat protein